MTKPTHIPRQLEAAIKPFRKPTKEYYQLSVFRGGRQIAEVRGIDEADTLVNAAHIVRCVNEREELIEALRLAYQWMKGQLYQEDEDLDDAIIMNKVAIALAKARITEAPCPPTNS